MPGKAIRARGIVQGVGFRPAIWHLARLHGLNGEVWNDGEGVMIQAFGSSENLALFVEQIPLQLPPLARLDALEVCDIPEADGQIEFRIVASRHDGIDTPIAADAATCPACLADIADPANRRYRYPFTNCTHCGPRLSIVRRVPYDRCHTSMAAFAMCSDCQREYDDPADRRFHAQANCCPLCGPKVWLEPAIVRVSDIKLSLLPPLTKGDRGGFIQKISPNPSATAPCVALPPASMQSSFSKRGAKHQDLYLMAASRSVRTIKDAIRQTADLIRQGRIVAIKGLGGFHLACDAGNAEAVNELRRRKRRYAKPFALMARDLEMVRRYAEINQQEVAALQSQAAPIVLLTAHGKSLAPGVAPGEHTLGFMLPYTPLHTLLMQELDTPIVLTSGNLSDEPQCIDNADALAKLAGIADFFLLHDRDIVNRLDDAVVRLMSGEIRLLRRARGYSPTMLKLPAGFERAGNILAMGAELKNSFCLLKHGQAIVAQHIGDLENAAVQQDYRHAIELYRNLHGFQIERIAIDRHPGYLSSQYGQTLAASEQVECVAVQHHHAHLAACLGENGIGLEAPPVLAAVFDGLGMGDDGQLWGGEFLLGDYRGYSRLGHLQAVALPGGNQAMREPWRNTYAQLRQYFDWPTLQHQYGELAICRLLAAKPLATLDTMMAKNLNSPLSSSCGRWFDAFAAALDLHAETIAYEGQAAISLENLAMAAMSQEQAYPDAYEIADEQSMAILRWQGLWQAVLHDLKADIAKSRIAARIHHSLAKATVDLLLRLSQNTGIDCIVLAGGVFQNRLLLETVSQSLLLHNKRVLQAKAYPLNDGGLALGQALIAAAQAIAR